jgi:hypothetical protein
MKNQIKSEEEIGNILLAEFMGWGESGIYHTPFEDAGMCNGEPSSICYDRNLLFNSDWNWLMLVVEKIESLGYAVLICYTRVVVECFIMSDKTVIYKNDNNSIPKIKNTFLSCVEFAKWYKNNSHE